MTTNKYFSDLYNAKTQDQQLIEDLIIENIQIHGRDLLYLPRDLTNFDEFFGEDQISSFNDALALEFFMESLQAWGDEGSFLSKFGMEIRDSATFACAQRRFKEEITSKYGSILRPREGDILVLPESIDHRRRCMEITFVRNEEIFYQMGKLYIWTVTVKNFEYTGEKFATGVKGVDDYSKEYGLTTVLTMAAGSGAYTPGEIVSQITGFEGTVISFASNVLVLSNVKGQIKTTHPVVGDTSSTSRNIATVDSAVGNDSTMNDNDYMEEQTTTGGLLDFTETNPFSET